ncbi:MAG TPA: PA2779 family protein [Gammaproteobacteria bacterium]|nr:PA2779 family protein [Gammaproteobacteria bacterium]
MTTFRKLSRVLAMPVALAMFLNLGVLPAAQAAMVPTDQVIDQTSADSDRERVRSFLAREDVQRQMETLGVDPDDAAARVAGLSDAEVQKIVNKLDELPAGQDAIGAILGVLVIILLVLLITDILCFTTFYPFTKCVTNR